ncbi:hypothetical protein CUU64_10475 [Bacillus sp. V5-8f]|nr:hypothetical protein CUU64_10475 [Bacillus sp. V5-8f]
MYLSMVLKLVIGLAALVFVTRLLGKKHMSQVTPFDFVYALILGGTVEETIYHQDHTIPQMLFSISVWGILIYSVERITMKYDKLRAPLKGSSQVLIKGGKVNIKELERANLELEQLSGMLRQKGIFSLKEVNYVFLETSGEISVLRYQDEDIVEEPSILLVNEGRVHENNLQEVGKDKDWLMQAINKDGIKLKDIYYAEYSEPKGFYIKTYDHCL